jgi:hypothetical protein
MQLRLLRCHTLIHSHNNLLPVLCGAVPEVRTDAEVVVFHTRARNVL